MVADIEHTTIYERTDDEVVVMGVKVIGASRTTITQSDGGPGKDDFCITVYSAESDFSEANTDAIRITPDMLLAMLRVANIAQVNVAHSQQPIDPNWAYKRAGDHG